MLVGNNTGLGHRVGAKITGNTEIDTIVVTEI